MLRHPWHLDADLRYRLDAIAESRREARLTAAAFGPPPRVWTRLRRGLGHGLIAAGERVAGDAPVSFRPTAATTGRAG